MKKELRIKNSSEIEQVMKKGYSKANKTFILYRLKNDQTERFRFAITASKKLGNAVTRNRIKRRIRAVIQQNQSLLVNGYDYFIIARPNILEIDHTELNKQFKHIVNLVSQKYTKK